MSRTRWWHYLIPNPRPNEALFNLLKVSSEERSAELVSFEHHDGKWILVVSVGGTTQEVRYEGAFWRHYPEGCRCSTYLDVRLGDIMHAIGWGVHDDKRTEQ